MGRRVALLIATYEYQDSGLRRLASPPHDAGALAEVLADPEIAGFEVTTLVNEPHHRVGEAIGDFYRDRRRDDLTLLYFTGHGLKDDGGHLYLAMANTRRDSLLFTALSADQVEQAMTGCASRRKVLILDCCYSGAFPAGRLAKADPDVHALERFQGRGRTVLTASDATQYSFEGNTLHGEAARSVFTHYLVAGLRDGSADLDGDGDITLDELYSYVHDRVVEEMPRQRPKRLDNVEGRTIIARNVNWTLPSYLTNAMRSPIAGDRLAALDGLDHLHRIGNSSVRAHVREALTELTDDDSKQVSAAAAARHQALLATPPVPEDSETPPDPNPAEPETSARSTPAVVEPEPAVESTAPAVGSGTAAPSPAPAAEPDTSRPPWQAWLRSRRARVVWLPVAGAVVVVAVVVSAILLPYGDKGGSEGGVAASPRLSAMAINPDGDHLYVTSADPPALKVLDTSTRETRQREFSTHLEPETPAGLAVSPDGKEILVAGLRTARNLHVFTTDSLVMSTIRLDGIPVGVAYRRDGDTAYVITRDPNTLQTVDLTTKTARPDPVPLREEPRDIAVDPNDQRVYIAFGNSITWHAIDNQHAEDSTLCGDTVLAISSGSFWRSCAAEGEVALVEPGRMGDVATAEVDSPSDMVLVKTRLYVPSADSGTVSVIDETNKVAGAPIRVGSRPLAAVADQDGKFVYVANSDQTVSVINTETNSTESPLSW